MRYKLIRAVWLFFALLVFTCAVLATATVNAVKIQPNILSLREKERVFYLYSASSQAERRRSVGACEIPFVKGESVEYVLPEDEVGEGGEEIARELLKKFGAEVYFIENVCGVKSYYAYAPDLYPPLPIKGARVNLHIAVKTGRVVVGSPLVFGGY